MRYEKFNDQIVLRSDGMVFKVNNDELTPAKTTPTGRGYLVFTWTEDGTQRHEYVHRAIANAFCEKPKDATEINHIDGDKQNNSADNLQWVTHEENMRHAREAGLMQHTCGICGKRTRMTKLCPECRKMKDDAKRAAAHADRRVGLWADAIYKHPKGKSAEYIALLASGYTLSEVGKMYGVTRQAISDKARKIKLEEIYG